MSQLKDAHTHLSTIFNEGSTISDRLRTNIHQNTDTRINRSFAPLTNRQPQDK
jgi:hypothetical protein